MRQTSLDAFSTVDLTARQSDVLEAIRALGECTDVELAASLDWPINRLTPRRGELVAANLVESCGTKIGPTGRHAHIWRIAQPKAAPMYRVEESGQGALVL